MATYTEVYIQELRKLVNESIDRLTEELASGSCKTIDEYRFRVGQIHAYRESLNITDEANKRTQQKLNGG